MPKTRSRNPSKQEQVRNILLQPRSIATRLLPLIPRSGQIQDLSDAEQRVPALNQHGPLALHRVHQLPLHRQTDVPGQNIPRLCKLDHLGRRSSVKRLGSIVRHERGGGAYLSRNQQRRQDSRGRDTGNYGDALL